MPENIFSTPDSLVEYAEELQGFHSTRDQQLLALQHAWESPIRTTETGRTIYINNEPWTATRLTVSLITRGRPYFKGYMPPDIGDTRERNAAISQVERALRAHFKNIDMTLYRQHRGTFLRMWSYHAAVHGWHSGLNLVLDAQENWPVFTDLWSPLDTFPDMDGTALVHVTRLTAHEIEKRFGKKAVRAAKSGYNFEDDKDGRFVKYVVYDYWDDETNASAVVGATDTYWIKKQVPHGLDHNPAWCNPIDGVPFRHSASDRNGALLRAPDAESGRWLQFVGQSPMLGYRTAYQYLSELANQIADVVERWANPLVMAKTDQGKYVEIDMSGKTHNVDLSTIVEVISPPKFPSDDRAWIEFIMRDIEKASYPRAAYGAVGSTEAAYTIQLMRAASGYIIDPLLEQAEFMYEASAESILKQLEKKKKQYDRFFFLRSTKSRSGKKTVEYIKLADLPENVQMTVEIRGAGIPQDKFQALAAVSNVMQLDTPPVSLETLLDDYLESDDPTGEVARVIMQKLAFNPAVFEKASPIVTLNNLAARLREKGTQQANDLADALGALSIQALHELRQFIQQASAQGKEVPPDIELRAMQAAAGGLASQPGQVGVAPIGAPTPGVPAPPTGPAPDRGALMQAALAARGGSLGGPGGSAI